MFFIVQLAVFVVRGFTARAMLMRWPAECGVVGSIRHWGMGVGGYDSKHGAVVIKMTTSRTCQRTTLGARQPLGCQ